MEQIRKSTSNQEPRGITHESKLKTGQRIKKESEANNSLFRLEHIPETLRDISNILEESKKMVPDPPQETEEQKNIGSGLNKEG